MVCAISPGNSYGVTSMTSMVSSILGISEMANINVKMKNCVWRLLRVLARIANRVRTAKETITKIREIVSAIWTIRGSVVVYAALFA